MQHAKQDPNPTNANSGNRESGKLELSLPSVVLMGNKSALGRNAEKHKQISSTIIKGVKYLHKSAASPHRDNGHARRSVAPENTYNIHKLQMDMIGILYAKGF